MCADTKNYTLPFLAVPSLKIGRAALLASFLFSILVHGAVIGSVIWSGQATSTALRVHGGKGTMIVLVAEGNQTEGTPEGVADTGAQPDHVTRSSQSSLQQVRADGAITQEPLSEDFSDPQVDTKIPSVKHKKVEIPDRLLPQRRRSGEKAAHQPSEVKSPVRHRQGSVQGKTVQKTSALDRSQRQAALHTKQKTGMQSASKGTGELIGMPTGKASGIGNSQGSAMGEAIHTRFGMDSGPSFVRFRQPDYPASARRRGISGLVVLRILISAEGKAERVEVVSSVDASLSRSACAAVRNAVFAPYRPDGKPVACWTEIPIRFQLESKE